MRRGPLTLFVISLALIVTVIIGISFATTVEIDHWPDLTLRASASATVHDRDMSESEEYTNGRLHIEILLTNGRLRDVDDPNYGFICTIKNPTRNWQVALSLDNKVSGPEYSQAGNLILGGDIDGNGFEDITISIPLNDSHRWTSGSTCNIEIDNFAPEGVGVDKVSNPFWDVGDSLEITFYGRDALKLTGDDAISLQGVKVDNYSS